MSLTPTVAPVTVKVVVQVDIGPMVAPVKVMTFDVTDSEPPQVGVAAILGVVKPVGSVPADAIDKGPSPLVPVPVVVAPVAAADAGKTAAPSGKAVYDANCQACHAAGVAGAPKLGDKAAWAPRIGSGAAALLASALKGKNAMPPKGGNVALPDADVKAAVEYMVSQSK